MENLEKKTYLHDIIFANVSSSSYIVLIDLGGYFSNILSHLSDSEKERILGIVEDTEAGHRRYEEQNWQEHPIVSVARSELKYAEDTLVGLSCIFSCEKLLRETGHLLQPRKSLVLGYGPVGAGVAHALQRRQCHVEVYDIDPVKRMHALGEGFPVPARDSALQNAHIIFGATGKMSVLPEDLSKLEHGVILVSCSSKEVEFPVNKLNDCFSCDTLAPNVKAFRDGNSEVILLAKGRPVNFLDGAVIGPMISASHAELILAAYRLYEGSLECGLGELSPSDKRTIANAWLENFCNLDQGLYRI